MNHPKIFIFLISISTLSTALECYFCDYVENDVNEYQCKDNPHKSCLYPVETDNEWYPKWRSFSPQFQNYTAHILQRIIAMAKEEEDKKNKKICAKVSGKSGGAHFITRFGAETKDEVKMGCVTIPDDNDMSERVMCYCDSDGCNGGNSVSVGFVLATILFSFFANLIY